MRMRELQVSYRNGRTVMQQRERDDAAGRQLIDKAAFDAMTDPRVLSVRVAPVQRHAGRSAR